MNRLNYYKSELDKYLTEPIRFSDYTETIYGVWEPLVEAALSFVVKDKNNRIVGALLNFDSNNEPIVPLIGGVRLLIEILRANEAPVLPRLPKDKPIVNEFLMGALNVSPSKNVAAMAVMEKELTRMAKEKGCAGVLITNIGPVTKQLCKNVNGYEILNEIQANQFVLDGMRPYAKAPDTYTITTEWKQL